MTYKRTQSTAAVILTQFLESQTTQREKLVPSYLLSLKKQSIEKIDCCYREYSNELTAREWEALLQTIEYKAEMFGGKATGVVTLTMDEKLKKLLGLSFFVAETKIIEEK